MSCGNCQEVFSTGSESVLCSSCAVKYHFDCSVREAKWRNMTPDQRNKWVCGKCKNTASNTSVVKAQQESTKLAVDDLSIKDLLLKMNSRLNALDEVKNTVVGISASLDFLSTKYDELLNEVRGYREESLKLKKEVEELRQGSFKLEDHIEVLTKKINVLEQYGRGINLEIHGVEELQGEDIGEVLKKTASALDLPYNASEVQAAHRIPSRNWQRPAMVLVQFVSKMTKQRWLQEGKKKRLLSKDIHGVSVARVFFNENLTPYFNQLFREVKRIAKDKGYDFVWVRNGSIKVKKSSESRQTLTITTYSDLRLIK